MWKVLLLVAFVASPDDTVVLEGDVVHATKDDCLVEAASRLAHVESLSKTGAVTNYWLGCHDTEASDFIETFGAAKVFKL